MIHLRSVSLKPEAERPAVDPDKFPFNLPFVKTLESVKFKSPVTFLVGENGSGKSTLLEAIGIGIYSVAVGREDLEYDETLNKVRELALSLRFVWQKRTSKGFFLRAEDFFNFARRINKMTEDLDKIANDFESELSGWGLARARGVALGEKRNLQLKYGEEGLDAHSHGESFLTLFQNRFVPGGLYLLDEPEAPLSPLRQLALLSMLKEMVELEAQFIIATHSPIIMAFPGATIYSFDSSPIKETSYDDLEHVTLTRSFLNNPDAYLRRL
jgi:predicted ATPase